MPADKSVPPDRTYTNGEINVYWRVPLCIHCEACKLGLPKVFDPKRRPWVDLSQATTVEIIDQVNACPSGALSYEIVNPACS